MVLAEIFGPEGIIVLLVIVAVLFAGPQIPKLARSLGSAKNEFEKGLAEGKDAESKDGSGKDAVRKDPTEDKA
jgi:sec-independent protein translocase protein TatA